MKVKTVTDAPESYDSFGTTTVAVLGRSSRGPVRLVSTPQEHLEWQRNRYHSGLHLSVTEHEWDEMGDLILLPEDPPVEATKPARPRCRGCELLLRAIREQDSPCRYCVHSGTESLPPFAPCTDCLTAGEDGKGWINFEPKEV